MNKLNYKEPRNKDLEKELWEHDDVFDYENAIRDKYFKTEADRENEEKQEAAEKEEQAVENATWNLFAKVYNETATYIPAGKAQDLISELTRWSEENSSNSVQEKLAEFLKLLKDASETPPKRDKRGRLDEIELNEELLEIVYLP